MKEYRLADAGFRKSVDLTNYKNDIDTAVHTVKPNATVTVNPEGFTVDPALSKRESIAVSTLLRAGQMNKLTTYRPCLLLGYKINNSNNTK